MDIGVATELANGDDAGSCLSPSAKDGFEVAEQDDDEDGDDYDDDYDDDDDDDEDGDDDEDDESDWDDLDQDDASETDLEEGGFFDEDYEAPGEFEEDHPPALTIDAMQKCVLKDSREKLYLWSGSVANGAQASIHLFREEGAGNRTVVVKIFGLRASRDSEDKVMRALAKLSHPAAGPHVLHLERDFDRYNSEGGEPCCGYFCLVTEHLAGESLPRYLEHNNIPADFGKTLINHTFSALRDLRRAGYTDYDRHANNVMVTANGTRIVLIDFGRPISVERRSDDLIGFKSAAEGELGFLRATHLLPEREQQRYDTVIAKLEERAKSTSESLDDLRTSQEVLEYLASPVE